MALDLLHFPRDTLRAVAFLSRMRVPSRVFDGDGDPAHASRTFPLAGALIALPAAAILSAAHFLGASPLLAAALAVAALVIITGALHEDGLADTADGFFAPRGNREDRLAIMKDSRNGTFGTLAVVLSQIVRIAALADLTALGPWQAGGLLVAVAAASRAVMVFHWQGLPLARPEGLSARFGQPSRGAALVAGAIGLAIALGILIAAGAAYGAFGAALLAAAITSVLFDRLCDRKIGGQTGDTIGAAQQLSEVAMLTALAIAL